MSAAPPKTPPSRRPLARYGRYLGAAGPREVAALRGAAGSVVVVDQLVGGGDPRLVAHLAPDEPAANGRLVASLYLGDPSRGCCRPLRRSDLTRPPADWLEGPGPVARRWWEPVRDGEGSCFRIAVQRGELRWSAWGKEPRAVTLREVIGTVESYEPALARTRGALRAAQPRCSRERLLRELNRLERSPVVLNRRLREAVARALAAGETTLGEIALRCGHLKRYPNGLLWGESTWLARRIGLAPEAAGQRPSPWIRSDLLATIARAGLGLDPREVEVL